MFLPAEIEGGLNGRPRPPTVWLGRRKEAAVGVVMHFRGGCGGVRPNRMHRILPIGGR